MLTELRPHRSRHAKLVAWLALFTAIGGGAYAAVDSGSKDIRDGQVQNVELGARQRGTRTYAAILHPDAATLTVRVVRATEGPQPEFKYVETGHWNVKFQRRNGLGCAFPGVTSMASSWVPFKVLFVNCDDNETDFDIVTDGGEDAAFLLHVDFGGTPW